MALCRGRGRLGARAYRYRDPMRILASDVPLKPGVVDIGLVQLDGNGDWKRQPCFIVRVATYDEWAATVPAGRKVETLPELHEQGYRYFYAYTTD